MINKAKNIKYNAADGVLVTDKMTSNAQRNINEWFDPFMDEINEKDGVFIVYFKAENDSTVTLSVSDQDLHTKAMNHVHSIYLNYR